MATAAEKLKEYESMFQRRQQALTVPQYQQGFEKAYGEATNYNADLIGQRSESIGQAQALPSQLRASYANSAIRNPLEQEALIGQRRGNITSDISRLTDLLGARNSRFQDVLGRYTQGYMADLEAEDRNLENQWRLYQDILAQEEAARARAQQQAYIDALIRANTPVDETVDTVDDLVIDTGENNWTEKLSSSTNPKVNILNALPIALGNYIGNQMVPKPTPTGRPLNWWEKITNTLSPVLGGGGEKAW